MDRFPRCTSHYPCFPHTVCSPFSFSVLLITVAAIALPTSEAIAVLDIEDNGPTLSAGGFAMRVTNAGILGNAFFGKGLSFDSSFEFPSYSGDECLNFASLWVGGRLHSGQVRVSGGPELEWRPNLAPEDRVRVAFRSDLGTERLVDDDGDGTIDEEWLDAKDNDADGRVDEDLGLEADEVAMATYADTSRAVALQPSGELHVPLGLSVRQTAMAWRSPALRGVAALRFQIRNIGLQPLSDVYLGLFVDLDSRKRSDRPGHLNDRVIRDTVSLIISEGTTSVTAAGRPFPRVCRSLIDADYVILRDGNGTSGLPAVAAVPLDHTVDPLAFIDEAKQYASAPAGLAFHSNTFLPMGSTSFGAIPILDIDRYDAMRNGRPNAPEDVAGDFSTLVSCGPFPKLIPGNTIEFSVALVAGATVDSVKATAERLLMIHHGVAMNLLSDSLPPSEANQYLSGTSGTFGHEACVAPPPGVIFVADPHCTSRFPEELGLPPTREVYRHDHCIWTNADCDFCTGFNGNDTRVRWMDLGSAAPAPRQLPTPGDHRIRIAWDNLPELLFDARRLGPYVRRVVGYRVYKLVGWRGRESALPPRRNWALLAAYSLTPGDTLNGERPIGTITDSTLDYAEILYEEKHFPIGRYALEDSQVHNGFDYVYQVSSVVELQFQVGEDSRRTLVESPLTARFDDVVVPHLMSDRPVSRVWVVPNPFRRTADWDRPPVAGDALGRHIDFLGLPRARCSIKIWTVAGDWVAQIDHDGSSGDSQASWNLVSRNGQEVESGIYLFTVDSELVHEIGRFVVIR